MSGSTAAAAAADDPQESSHEACSVPDCNKPSKTRGYCTGHYSRLLRHGDPLAGGAKRHRGLTPAQRFAQYTSPTAGGCSEWTGHIEQGGYGRFSVRGWPVSAHRFAYQQAYGPIHPDAHIDHVCENRVCVRPDHLQPVTMFLNTALIRIRKGDCEDWERQACIVQGIRIHLDDAAPASAAAVAPFDPL